MGQTASKTGAIPCRACRARCCRYVAVEVDRPRTAGDRDIVRWYLLHRDVQVFVDHEGDWFVEFATPCTALRGGHRCSIYPRRPAICREHGWPEDSCEYFESPYRHCFRTVAEYEAFLRRRRPSGRSSAKKRPVRREARA